MKTHQAFMYRQLLAALAGTAVGIVILSMLVLPHDWKPMGRWDTFKIFGMLLIGAHIAFWLLFLVPFSIWVKRLKFRLTPLQAMFVGGGIYCALVGVYQLCFDRPSWDILWFCILAFPVGGITSLTYSQLSQDALTGAEDE